MDSKPAAEGLRARHKTDSVGEDSPKPVAAGRGGKVHAQVAAAQVQDVISLLLALRFLNALCVRTFFQPDEYFQALEPAWRIAFGRDSGAWLTWVLLLWDIEIDRVAGLLMYCFNSGMATPAQVVAPSRHLRAGVQGRG